MLVISRKLLSIPHRRQTLLMRWRSSALAACLKEAIGSPASELHNARYDSTEQLIVTEEFPYKPRTAQEQQVADWLKHRYEKRAEFEKKLKGSRGADKWFNPIIAVTGAPGMGKSSFLAHLPNSTAFERYHKLTGAAAPPIVSALTFNGLTPIDSNDKGHDLGLRVLYGAYSCMGGPRSLPALDWSTFKEFFSAAHPEHIYARNAVLALREVYGPERRVLLLVDEVSKAALHGQPGWDVKALQELGGVLDKYSWVDAVVSSLSAPYIESLVTTASQRRVNYLALPLLLEAMEGAERLGGKDASECATAVFKAAKVNSSLSPWTYNLLRNLPLLTSGHPRSLQYLLLAQTLEEDSSSRKKQLPPCWDEVVEDVGSGKGVGRVLLTVTEKIIHSECKFELDEAYFQKVLPLVLSCRALNPMSHTEESVLLRQLVESGQIYLVPSDKRALRAAIRYDNFVSLARWAAKQKQPDDFVQALAMLLGKDVVEVEKTSATKYEDPRDDPTINNLTVLWERAVALTVVGRSLGETDSVLGQGVSRFENTPALSAMIAQNKIDLEVLRPNTLTITPHKHPGSDAQVMVRDESPSSASPDERVAYLQFKIEISSKQQTLERVAAKIVVYSLRDHLQRQCTQRIPLNNVCMALYVWDSLPSIDAKTLEEEVDIRLKNARRRNEANDKPGELCSMSNSAYEELCLAAKEFVTTHRANIHVMDKAKLDAWLIPSLRPIPRLVQATISQK